MLRIRQLEALSAVISTGSISRCLLFGDQSARNEPSYIRSF